jgi:hypothetical protein
VASDLTAASQQTGNLPRAELGDRGRTVLVVCGKAHDAREAVELLGALGVADPDSMRTAKTLAQFDRRAR